MNANSASPSNQLWERACSRRGRHLQHRRRLPPRHREQARSHSNSRPGTNSAVTEQPVGAGLPAIRPAQAISAVPDPPLSRASPLPHGISSERKPCIHPNQLWERACSRRGRHLQHRRRLPPRHREQARSHSNSRPGTNSAVTEQPVGAGLPAIRPAQAISAVPDPPLSRASILRSLSNLWELSCQR